MIDFNDLSPEAEEEFFVECERVMKRDIVWDDLPADLQGRFEQTAMKQMQDAATASNDDARIEAWRDAA